MSISSNETKTGQRPASGVTKAESLGYRKPKYIERKKPTQFNSKREKWQYMQDHGLSEIYQLVKDIFGDIGEPEIFIAPVE